MNPLSETRSARASTHLLQTPDTFVRTPMPAITGGTAIVHAAPALGAGFLQYTAELDEGGMLTGGPHQRFLYMLEGVAQLTIFEDNFLRGTLSEHALRHGSYAYLPPASVSELRAVTRLRVAVIEKRYEPLYEGARSFPRMLVGREGEVEPMPLDGDERLLVRSLLPADMLFDFAVNTMEYAPGAALAQVELHYMEHGLLMLEGAGPYRLGDTSYDVQTGDFIWMAPFCPQWFEASAAGPAKYLIYKNFHRMPAL